MDNFSLIPPADKEPIKLARVLHCLYEGFSLNRFEAASLLHDSCLNTTISDIRNDLNITIIGELEQVNGYMGNPTRCNRYKIDTSAKNMDIARKLLIDYYGYQPSYKTAS